MNYLIQLKILWAFRHQGVIQWQGGYVYPRDEIRRVIKILRRSQTH